MNFPIVIQHKTGPLDNFIYLIGDSETKTMAVVDPAWDADFILQEPARRGFTLAMVLITHGHPDHINALDQVLAKTSIPAYVSQSEHPLLKPRNPQCRDVSDGAMIMLGKTEIRVMAVPGHSPGGVCYHIGQNLLTGDTLFIDAIGRVDLPGSDARVMYQTLEKIKALPNETIIWSGHDYGPAPSDTLGHQKQTNPYLAANSLTEFMRMV